MTEYQPLIDAGHGEYLHRGAEPVDWASLAEPMAPSGAAAGAGLGPGGGSPGPEAEAESGS